MKFYRLFCAPNLFALSLSRFKTVMEYGSVATEKNNVLVEYELILDLGKYFISKSLFLMINYHYLMILILFHP